MSGPGSTHLNPVPDPSELEHVIGSIAARWLDTSERALNPTTPFALMGLDSLATIELGAALESALGLELSPEVMAECRDIRSLAARVQADRSRSNAARSGLDPLAKMLADSVLPEDVYPHRRDKRPRVGGLLKAKRILVTGATGFVGGQLAADLIERSAASLVCLVRDGSMSGRRRLFDRLASLGVTRGLFAARVETVEGDLSQTRLGLTEAAFAAAGDRVEAILHAGASVNWVYPYASLRGANVLGTRELLRLACRRSVPFHFVSSLSVCYASCGPGRADERFEPLEHLHGIHLGYAQSKAVAEALVREAGRRGLPAHIYRPSLVTGNSRTGAFNADDLLSLMIKGCIHMGAAPDLDWALDCIPVDIVSRDILALSACRERSSIFHLTHARPRHWRECLLWMNLYGYPIRLTPYRDWLRQLEIATDPCCPGSSTHPLRALKSFFLDRPLHSLTLPELYEESRRTRAVAPRTSRELSRHTSSKPALDAALLERYFDAFVSSRHLSPPERRPSTGAVPEPHALDEAFFTRALATRSDTVVERAELISSGSEHSIVSELTAWQSRRTANLLHYRLQFRDGGRSRTRDVMVKIKPRDRVVLEVGRALAALCDRRLGDAYDRWGHRTGVLGSHLRERAIYEMTDDRLRRHVPELLGLDVDERTGECVLVIERITNAILMDSVQRSPEWSRAHLDVAIRGLATLHAARWQRVEGLFDMPWIGFVQSSRSATEAIGLWTALAAHAAPLFSSWAPGDLVSIQTRLIESMDRWWNVLDQSPRTLIHHDFNPRNICLRMQRSRSSLQPTLCAYDWELATIGAAQRDLAELLCFVLPPAAGDEEIDFWIDRHRLLLMRETSAAIDPVEWRRGFGAAMYDLLVQRLGIYALVHRVKPQAYLPRVVRTWRRLYERFPLEALGS
jgi:thioester reductase-like protein